MNYANLFKIALKAIRNNKIRSLLTMLGIIIGITAVIIMISLGQGAKSSIKGEISSIGSNLINIWPASADESGVRRSAADMQSMKMSDYEALKREARYLRYISPSFSISGQAIVGNSNTPTTIYGVNTDYLKIQGFEVLAGEMFTDEHIREIAKVCLLGQTVVEELFDGDNDAALGSVIRFNSLPIRVIGVLGSKGSSAMGSDQDDIIIAPYSTVQKRVMAIDYVPSIVASGLSEEYSGQAIDEITAILRQQHGIKGDAKNNFRVMSMDEILDTIEQVMNTLTLFLAAIAFISLIVGGVGIMNIMYVSVTERTREIGLRMSIGAKPNQILMQFLIEAVMISVTGGIIGILSGVTLNGLISLILKMTGASMTMLISVKSIIVSFLVCTVTGIFFGWYPARKAARLDPIDALRYE
ncbi:MAG: ABC transporter permease [Bacteroidales bacterium]|nr:ABC transporter permease [Bacteroidales bacterium]